MKNKSTFRILILINVRWWNATAFYAVNIARILQKKGHRVFIGCNKDYPAYKIARSYGLEVVPINFYGFNIFHLFSSFVRMLRLIKKEKIQIINSHRSEDHTFALLAKLITRVKIVITRGDQRLITRNFLSSLRYRFCDGIILTCQSIFLQNKRIFFPIRHKVRIIYGSVDEDHFKTRGKAKYTAKKYNIDTKKIIVGTVGRLSQVKDQETFAKAAEIILESFPEVIFVVAGKQVNLQFLEFSRLLEKLNIRHRFILVPLIDDISELMDLFDIGVITSVFSETISRVLLEYMVLYKPVVGTTVNAIGEIIKPGINGELFRPKDFKALANHLKALIQNPALRKEYGENSYKLYKTYYSEEIFYSKTIKTFESLT